MADVASPLEVMLMTAWANRCAMNSATPSQFGANAARELGEVCRAFNAEIARMSAPSGGDTVYDPATGFMRPASVAEMSDEAPGVGVVDPGVRLGLVPDSADVALPEAAVEASENALLASVETRLTQEMHGLALALGKFARRTKSIREEIPASAQFCKLVAGFFPLVAFQLADALLSQPEGFTFEDDGALYLKKLGLEVKDFVREVDLEGRKFLAVALLNKSGRNVLDGAANGDEL